MDLELLEVEKNLAIFDVRFSYERINLNRAELTIEEKISLGKATHHRLCEFSAGRIAAKNALSKLGVQCLSIPTSDCRRPVWPEKIIGSISHSNNLALATVANKSNFKSIGLDVEFFQEDDLDMLNEILTDKEKVSFEKYSKNEKLKKLNAIYSAKESIYKALSGFANFEDLNFLDVEVALQDRGVFTFSLIDLDQPPFNFSGVIFELEKCVISLSLIKV